MLSEVRTVAFDFSLVRKLSACHYGHFRLSPLFDVTATTRENSCFYRKVGKVKKKYVLMRFYESVHINL